MSTKERVYKIKVDKDILTDFFKVDVCDIKQKHLDELDKVMNIILSKYYNKYYNLFEDLKSLALLAIMERRERYDPTYSAYNYIYTVFRNEIGNRIIAMTKEYYVDDIVGYMKNISDTNEEGNLPQEIERYKSHLLGTCDFVIERIPKKDIAPLAIFLRMHEKHNTGRIPSFIKCNSEYTNILYKLVRDLL